MGMAEWLQARTKEWQDLADAVDRLRVAPTVTVQVALAGDDAAQAEAVKRGQRPELIAALRRAL